MKKTMRLKPWSARLPVERGYYQMRYSAIRPATDHKSMQIQREIHVRLQREHVPVQRPPKFKRVMR